MSDIQEFELGDTEVQKLTAARTDVQNNSRLAAQKALAFFENIAEGIKAVNLADEAQSEYIRLLTRAAKARGRHYNDIVDVDYNAKKIVFKKKEDIGGKEAPDDDGGEETAPSGDSE